MIKQIEQKNMFENKIISKKCGVLNDMISDFKLLDNLGGYDKVANPDRLSIFELLPDGVEWSSNGQRNERKHHDKIIALLLKDNVDIALITSPFHKKENQAYIITPLNKTKWNLGELVRNDMEGVIFSDVHYVLNEPCFFIHVERRDYRFVFDPKTGKIGNLLPAY